MNRKAVGWFIVGLAITVFIAVGVSQFASDDPDGLEYVAEQQGFGGEADDHDLAEAPLAGYGENLESDSRISTGIAGVVGVLHASARTVDREPHREVSGGHPHQRHH